MKTDFPWVITSLLTAIIILAAPALSNDYDYRPSDSDGNRDSGRCAIGYGCKD